MAAATSISSPASVSRHSVMRTLVWPRRLTEQASTLMHTSNLFFHPLQGEVATRLAALSGLPRTFFCNSGTEAVEACLKFARRFWYAQGTPRSAFVALEHSFHGRTIGSLSVTWDEHYRTPFAPLLADVQWVPERRSRRARCARSLRPPRRSSRSRCRAKAASGRSRSRWRTRLRGPAPAPARC